MPATVKETRYRSEPAVQLAADELQATFLPNLGMTGVSLRYRDAEYLATPGGLVGLRAGKTLGLPLLAPWANRLGDPPVPRRGRHRRPGRPVAHHG